MAPLSLVMALDGGLFVLISVIVLVAPNPQPGLRNKLEPSALEPFEDTRRLLGAMFLASGLLLLIFAFGVADRQTLLLVVGARLVSFAIVAIINVKQLRRRMWKAPPLAILCTIWAVLAVAYTAIATLTP